MSLRDLENASLHFIMFGGKGGVGKTTMAVATAMQLAQSRKVLIFTTDPAPSLADSLGQPVGSEPTAVSSIPNLFAMEINAQKVLKEFQDQYHSELLDILQQGTYLADQEIEELFHLEIPGLDELMSFKKIMDFMDASEYERYFVDTAPTGHSLRLLVLPDLLNDWIKFLAALRWKYHTMARHFARREHVENSDAFLLEMKKTVKRVRTWLRDKERTEFVIVTIAEKMAVAEAEDLIRSLEHIHVPSRHIIVNNLFPQEESQFAIQRRKSQEKYVQALKEKYPKRNITEVVLQPTEIQGVASLDALGAQLFSRIEEKKG